METPVSELEVEAKPNKVYSFWADITVRDVSDGREIIKEIVFLKADSFVRMKEEGKLFYIYLLCLIFSLILFPN